MLQGVYTALFNPLVPKVQNSECQNLLFNDSALDWVHSYAADRERRWTREGRKN